MSSSHLTSQPLVALPYPTRFGWKMRAFLTVFIFCLVYRCFADVLPMTYWCRALAMEELPKALPSPAERAALRANAKAGEPDPVWAAYRATGESLLAYWTPWPGPETRERIQTRKDGMRWAACWLYYRLCFLERLLAISESWRMYAPTLWTYKTPTRARLLYDDGSEIILRQTAEPEDYTSYTHWLDERIVNYEGEVLIDGSLAPMRGYCNLLAHRHAVNQNGAKLTKIVLFAVKVWLVPPNGDALAHYQEQNQLTADDNLLSDQLLDDFYEFNVER